MNEVSMIKLLIDRVEANGDDGRKQVLGHHGQISDLCASLLTRLHAGDQEAVRDIAKVHLLNEAVQNRREKSDQARKLAMSFQDAVICLYSMPIDNYRDQIDNAITKLELEKSVAK